jgi:hypothetical protein
MFSQVPRTPAAGCYYLNPLTPESQEMYLRFDQTARRSPYRMSRILARHHLVTKIQQGELRALPRCRLFLLALSCAAYKVIVCAVHRTDSYATLRGTLSDNFRLRF